MKVGFTGTQKGMYFEQKTAFKKLLRTLNAVELHHGDCVGADTDAHHIAEELGLGIVVHPPDNPAKRSFCGGKQEPERPYLSRNKDIVNSTSILIATPLTAREVQRSGTWFTIRYARKTGKTVYIIEPDGSLKKENFRE